MSKCIHSALLAEIEYLKSRRSASTYKAFSLNVDESLQTFARTDVDDCRAKSSVTKAKSDSQMTNADFFVYLLGYKLVYSFVVAVFDAVPWVRYYCLGFGLFVARSKYFLKLRYHTKWEHYLCDRSCQ